MGVIDLFKVEDEFYVNFPEMVDKKFITTFLSQIDSANLDSSVTFDFQKTLSIDASFYPVLHQIKKRIKKNDGVIKSLNINMRLKSQLQNDGVLRMFNLHSSSHEEKNNNGSKKIEVEFITPFIESTIEILKIQADVNVTSEKPLLKDKLGDYQFDIGGVITLISNVFEGSISLCFKAPVFLKICEKMLGEEYKEINEEVEDAAGEILNIIFGMSKAKLNDEKGYKIVKAIPTVLLGAGIQVKQTIGPTLILPFNSDCGKFHLEVELSEPRGE